MKSKICLIYNFAQHYRSNIFSLLDKNLDIDFVFGDKYLNVKKMDYSILKHKVTEVKNIEFGPILWQKGVIATLFKGYDKYILLGEPMNLSTWIVLLLGRLFNKKVYFWTHGWYGRESWLKAKIKKLYFSCANATMVYGNYARELMIKEGLDSKKLFTIYNSLQYDSQLEIRNTITQTQIYQEHFKNNNPVLVMIGRLNLRKKLNMLIEAVALLHQKGKKFNIVFIGEGDDLKKLEQITIENCLHESVWFYGACYDEKTNAELLYNADMCVVPGDIGLTAIHSLMFGVPVVTHNCFKYQGPEFEAIISGRTGDFYEYGDIHSLADTINSWFVKNRYNRQTIRKACFKEIDDHWNPHVQLKIIKQAVGV